MAQATVRVSAQQIRDDVAVTANLHDILQSAVDEIGHGISPPKE
jgi:hypothetical protein